MWCSDSNSEPVKLTIPDCKSLTEMLDSDFLVRCIRFTEVVTRYFFRCFSVHSGFESKETVTLSWTLFFTFGASFCFRSVECLRNGKLRSLSAAFSALQLFVVVIHLYFRYVFLFLKFSKKKLARLMKRFSSLARKPRWSATGLNWIGVAEFFCFKERISSLSSIA